MMKKEEAEKLLGKWQQAGLKVTLGEQGTMTAESLRQEREKDSVLDSQINRIHDELNDRYKTRMVEEHAAIEAEGFNDEELNQLARESLLSPVYGTTETDVAIASGKERYDAIANRISKLWLGKYCRFQIVRNEVARGLSLIQSENLYLLAGYKNIYEMAKDVLNISKSTTSNFVRIGKRFLDKKRPVSIFYDNETGMDFSYTQLVQLLAFTYEEIRFCMETGLLTFNDNASAIKSLAKVVKQERKEQEVKESLKPLQSHYDEFHAAYGELKAMLDNCGDGQTIDVDEISTRMDKIMDAVTGLYGDGLFNTMK